MPLSVTSPLGCGRRFAFFADAARWLFCVFSHVDADCPDSLCFIDYCKTLCPAGRSVLRILWLILEVPFFAFLSSHWSVISDERIRAGIKTPPWHLLSPSFNYYARPLSYIFFLFSVCGAVTFFFFFFWDSFEARTFFL